MQRTVAVAMIVSNMIPMVLIVQQLILSLAVANVLFAVALVLTWARPRAGVISVGVLSGLWLLLNLVNLSQVIPDLTRPSATLFFLITLAHLALPVAGIVGMLGVLRRTSSLIAIRTLQALGTVMIGGVALSLLANL